MQQGKLDSDYQSAVQELTSLKAQLKSAQQTAEAKEDTQKKYNNLAGKYSNLNKEYQNLMSANKDLVQVKPKPERHCVTKLLHVVMSVFAAYVV